MSGLSSYHGTNNNRWAIGNDLVELRNINNELYFRLPNGTFSKVISESQFNSLSRSLRYWQSNTFFAANELIIYNGIIYVCNNDHTSGMTFESDTSNFTFVSVFEGFLLVTPTNLGSTVLDKTSGTLIYVDSAPGSGTYKFVLPNATTIQLGHKFKIINASTTYNLDIYYNDGITKLISIPPGITREVFYIKPNLTNGIFTTSDTPLSGTTVVEQVAHGFSFGQLIYIEDTTGIWKLATAADENKTCDAIVSAIYSADSFQATFNGYVNGNFPLPIILGRQYFLSDATPGEYVDVEPLYISQPIFKVITTNQILFRSDRPSENIVNGVEFTLNPGQSISLGPDSAQYIIYLRSDPRVLADTRYLSGNPPEFAPWSSPKPIANTDTPATLSIFDGAGQLYVKNNLVGQEKVLVFKNYVSP